MNAEAEIQKTVVPIARGLEIKNRRARLERDAADPQSATMRRLMQCVLMAVELVQEASRKQ